MGTPEAHVNYALHDLTEFAQTVENFLGNEKNKAMNNVLEKAIEKTALWNIYKEFVPLQERFNHERMRLCSNPPAFLPPKEGRAISDLIYEYECIDAAMLLTFTHLYRAVLLEDEFMNLQEVEPKND